MKILQDIIKKIENILSVLENILNEEYQNLLNPSLDLEKFNLIVKKKEQYFKMFFKLNQERIFFEKKNSIFIPYKNNYELEKSWKLIIKKCLILKKINFQSKILLNKKFHYNQRFLELFLSYRKCITYNIKGNLEI